MKGRANSTAVMARRLPLDGGSMLPEGAGAVMAGRASGEVEGDDARQALYRQLDYFPTPPWAARAGAELVRHLDPEARSIWEPACGEGHMAAPLAESFEVFASDIYPFGHGAEIDFLGDVEAERLEHDWIVSNPPFRTAGEFIRLAMARARRGVAMLLRVQFLEGVGRYRLMYGAEPLTICAVFAERVPMALGRWVPDQDTATAYAWFLWKKGAGGNPRLMGVPPGTRDRLWKSDDARRFGWAPEAGLLDAMEAAV